MPSNLDSLINLKPNNCNIQPPKNTNHAATFHLRDIHSEAHLILRISFMIPYHASSLVII